MREKLTERRRNYFIDKEFQARFILKFCLLVMAGTLISGALVYLFSMSTVTTSFVNSRLTLKSTADFILPAILVSSAVVIVTIGAATIFVTLFTSHKIVGPLYRLEKDIICLKEGDLKTAFHLRKADQLQGLLNSLNELSRACHERISTAKYAFLELEKLLSEGDTSAAKEKIAHLKGYFSRFKT